jgi:hypothetical protein
MKRSGSHSSRDPSNVLYSDVAQKIYLFSERLQSAYVLKIEKNNSLSVRSVNGKVFAETAMYNECRRFLKEMNVLLRELLSILAGKSIRFPGGFDVKLSFSKKSGRSRAYSNGDYEDRKVYFLQTLSSYRSIKGFPDTFVILLTGTLLHEYLHALQDAAIRYRKDESNLQKWMVEEGVIYRAENVIMSGIIHEIRRSYRGFGVKSYPDAAYDSLEKRLLRLCKKDRRKFISLASYLTGNMVTEKKIRRDGKSLWSMSTKNKNFNRIASHEMKKHGAGVNSALFAASVTLGRALVTVAEIGHGWDAHGLLSSFSAIRGTDDLYRAAEKGITRTRGNKFGLFHNVYSPS